MPPPAWTSPPAAVGSCHDLTKREAWAVSEPDPAVPCSERHTTVTTAIVQLTRTPDWDDVRALSRRMWVECVRSVDALLPGSTAARVRSAYTIYWFIPTEAQRAAGARWIRCDLGLPDGKRLRPLPASGPELGRLPLPDRIARCRLGRAAYYEVVRCAHRHAFRATHHVRRTGSFPGARVMRRWAERVCRARIPRAGIYLEYPTTKQSWKAGFRFAVCLKQTRR
ncbi:septum formation family protein [Nocardioides sp. TF02-7]|uniref:septum formation family protein n=1 Tax=Nocardioides sp. TF02-7 TaxID=2917724 RepID=UPI001F061BF9|nr:septum formation family protein [Nocardioides sp. TF02-7]UMG94617.1 septum formation family protein [Nocardioides sp. TF02-7]